MSFEYMADVIVLALAGLVLCAWYSIGDDEGGSDDEQ